MRGKLPVLLVDDAAARIIPARAGQTGAFCPVRRVDADHPRACGANRVAPAQVAGDAGSSPRVRGKRVPAVEPVAGNRIIPARAGQT